MMGNGKDPAEVSDRDREVAATVIQWLGSPVGGRDDQLLLGLLPGRLCSAGAAIGA